MEQRVEVDPVVLMCAFRYALGSKSYMPSIVAAELARNLDALRPDWRRQIIRDVGTAIEHGDAGFPHHVEVWRAVAVAMEESL